MYGKRANKYKFVRKQGRYSLILQNGRVKSKEDTEREKRGLQW